MNFIAEMNLAPYQLWLIFGGLLLISELAGTAGYLLWSGISAIIIGAITWLLPISWPWQWILFLLLTLLTLGLWWNWQRNSHSRNKSQQLNQPSTRFIGQHSVIMEPIYNGFGRVKIADGSWRAKCAQELPKGTNVEIIGVEGNTLEVKAIEPQ